MLGVGLTETGLVKYLIGQLLLSEGDRVDTLREFAPSAVDSDWELTSPGSASRSSARKGAGGVLEFGTTVLTAADGSIAGLLGASPGASTAVPAMLDVMERCFADQYQGWLPKLKEMVPSLGTKLSGEPALFDEVWAGAPSAQAGRVERRSSHRGRTDAPSPAADSDDRRRASYDGRAAPQLGQGSGRRDALRAAEAARRGVRRRAGLPVPRTRRPRPARRNPPLLAGRR